MFIPSRVLAASTSDGPQVTDWLSVVLSSIAIIIGVLVAWYVARQTATFHRENRDHDALEHRLEEQSFSRDRYDALVQLGVGILGAARQIQYATSTRWAHLVGMDTVPDSPGDDEGRLAGGALLATLETNAELLILSDKLLPEPPDGVAPELLDNALETLRTEAAWLVGDANGALISFYGGQDYNPDLSGTRAQIIENLVESSIQNISRRLLFGHADHVPYWREEGSPWPQAYRDRVDALIAVDPEGKSDRIFRSSTAAEANLLLAQGIEWFSTALFALINASDESRRSRRWGAANSAVR